MVAALSALAIVLSAVIPLMLTTRRQVRRSTNEITSQLYDGLHEPLVEIAKALDHHVKWEERQKYDELGRELTKIRRLLEKQ